MCLSLNRREVDFETLLDFNEYLQQKEDLIWNLVKGIDIEQTEKKLTSYAKVNKAAIAQNVALAEAETATIKDQEVMRIERSALARSAALKDIESEKADREAGRRQVVDRLAHGRLGDAEVIAQSEALATRKQSSLKRAAQERMREEMAAAMPSTALGAESAAAGGADSLGFKGLRKQEAPKVELPYDAFGGLHIRTVYYSLQDSYDHGWSDRVKTDPLFTAGGYDVREYYARAQMDAHAGLGVFLGRAKMQEEVAAAK